MSLITRTGKGSKITIEEMDNNLDYLESLGVKDITLEDTTIKFERVDGSFLEVDTNNNLPIVTKRILGSSEEEDDTVLYKGILDYSMTASQYLPLLYTNSTKSGELNIPVEFGKSYFINGQLLICSDEDVYNYFTFSSSLLTDSRYPGGFESPFSSLRNGSYVTIIQPDGKIITSLDKLYWLNPDGSIDKTLDYSVAAMALQTDGKLILSGTKIGTINTTYTSTNFVYEDSGLGYNYLDFNDVLDFNNSIYEVIQDNVTYELIFDGATYSAYYDSNDSRWFFIDDVEPPLFIEGPAIFQNNSTFQYYYDSGLGYNYLYFYDANIYQVNGGPIEDNITYELIFDGATYSAYYDSTYTDDTNGIYGRWFFIDDVEPLPENVNNELIISSVSIRIPIEYYELIIDSVSINIPIYYSQIVTNIEIIERLNEIVFLRLNSDGSQDDSFNIGTGFSNNLLEAINPNSITIQSDGKILAGGRFTTYNGVSTNYIIRLNSDGSRDTSFNTAYIYQWVNLILLQSDGKILFGGLSGRIERLNSDGSQDTSFESAYINDTVYSIVIQSDGKILVGGNFTSYNGVTSNRIIRLNTDGSRDTTFVIGTGFNGTVYSIAVQSDGKILVGGSFTAYNGVIFKRTIIRLNTDGSIDNTFIVGTGFDNPVSKIVVQS